MKNILFIIFTFSIFELCHCENTSQPILNKGSNEVYIYLDVDELPKFNTDDLSLTEYISREFRWSEMFDGWKSISIFSFIITKEGILKDIELEFGICPEIDEEIIRAIKSSPKWTPGKKNNKLVDVKLYFTYSCSF